MQTALNAPTHLQFGASSRKGSTLVISATVRLCDLRSGATAERLARPIGKHTCKKNAPARSTGILFTFALSRLPKRFGAFISYYFPETYDLFGVEDWPNSEPNPTTGCVIAQHLRSACQEEEA
jgi:hypothetical protein